MEIDPVDLLKTILAAVALTNVLIIDSRIMFITLHSYVVWGNAHASVFDFNPL